MIRIIKITARDEAGRKAQLQRLEAWMSSHGWRLADYAEEAGSALFEREEGAPSLSRVHPTRWLPAPEAWKPRQWLQVLQAEPRLVLLPLVLVLLLVAALTVSSLRPDGEGSSLAERNAREDWRVVTANQLNVREAPQIKAQVVGVLYRDQRVLVEGEVDQDWVRVSLPERGYVAAKFLRRVTPQPASSP